LSFAPEALPGSGEPARLADEIDRWISSAPMSALLEAFGRPPLRAGSVAARLDELVRFGLRRWNFRAGRERAETPGETFDPPLDALIRAATGALGLAGRQLPAGRAFDHVLVLGGGVRTMVARSRHAATILDSGVTTGSIAGLGSTRELAGWQDTAREFGLGDCPTEGDAVDEALRRVFRLGGPAEFSAGRTGLDQQWWLRSYRDRSPVVHVLAAPPTKPPRRADTGDSMIGWAELVERSPRGARVLVVTSDLYVPFQHCAAIRLLGMPHGCVVETVGFDTSAGDFLPPTTAAQLLQETLAAVRTMHLLHSAL